MRSAWLIRLGLFIYDHLGSRKILPPTQSVELRANPLGKPLKKVFPVPLNTRIVGYKTHA